MYYFTNVLHIITQVRKEASQDARKQIASPTTSPNAVQQTNKYLGTALHFYDHNSKIKRNALLFKKKGTDIANDDVGHPFDTSKCRLLNQLEVIVQVDDFRQAEVSGLPSKDHGRVLGCVLLLWVIWIPGTETQTPELYKPFHGMMRDEKDIVASLLQARRNAKDGLDFITVSVNDEGEFEELFGALLHGTLGWLVCAKGIHG